MAGPYDYTIGGPNPVDALMRGVEFGTGLRANEQNMAAQAQNMEAQRQNMAIAAAQEGRAVDMAPLQIQQAQQGLAAGAQNMEAQRINMDAARAQQDAAQAAMARKQAFSQRMIDLTNLGPSATFEDYQRVGAEFPEFSEGINEGWQSLDKNRKAGVQRTLMQIGAALKSGATDTAIQMANDYADAAENSGDAQSAASARAMAEMARTNPNAALASLGLTVSAIDPDAAKSMFGTGATVQSTTSVGNGRISVQTMNNGQVRVVDSATGSQLTGEDAANAIRAAEQAGIDEQSARAGGRAAATADVAVGTGEQVKAAESIGGQRGTMLANADKTISNINNTVRNIDRAIAAIDAGGGAGAIERYLPNVTEASAELRNAMDAMGLDVIGSVTFGALSDGERALAMETAVPRGLSEVALRRWLQAKKEAQNKMKVAVLEQAQFLSNPNNTMQDWYDQVSGDEPAPDRAAGVAPSSTSAQPTGQTGGDADFLAQMQAKKARGEAFTPDEVARIQSLAR